jgi:hypothetical protein
MKRGYDFFAGALFIIGKLPVPLYDQALETKKSGVDVLHRYMMGVNYFILLLLLCLLQSLTPTVVFVR